ncbi:hypothetical protein H5410_064022 [Solanum commersonii]|uniref:Uncharacterized protein n=1 Tax=Solanum commersonii TaxID=4109 RepID=A0A9J5W0N9_SOLCO|nr:hypothetical protein H5410_064022 [Solanum commersonii]
MFNCCSHGTLLHFGLQSSRLNICYYHQDLHPRRLHPGPRPGFAATAAPSYSSGPALAPTAGYERFARRYRCGPPPEFPRLRPASGIVHHLWVPTGMLTLEPFSEDQGRSAVHPGDPTNRLPYALRVYSPVDFAHMSDSLVRVSRRVEWGAHRPASGRADAKHAGGARCLPQCRGGGVPRAYREPGLWPPPIHAGPRPESIGGPARRRSTSGRGASPAPIRFPPDNFKHSLTLFSKSFSSFPRAACVVRRVRHNGALTLSGAPSGDLGPVRQGASPGLQFGRQGPPDSKAGLFPVRSPLLRESFRALGAHGRPASAPRRALRRAGATRSRGARRACPRPNGRAQLAFKDFDGSRGLRNSHQVSHFATFFIDREPRYPLRESFVFKEQRASPGWAADFSIPWRFPRRGSLGPGELAQAGAGGEARDARRPKCFKSVLAGRYAFAGFDNDPSAGSPTETLLRLLLPLNDKISGINGQIAPPTKSGHAPPPIESRKSSRSVNPYYADCNLEARPGQLRPEAHRRQKGRGGRCTPRADRPARPKVQLRAFKLQQLKYRYWAGITRLRHRTCPPMDPR